MAGTVTYTREYLKEPDRHYVGEEITVSWTSDSSGNADKLLPRLTGWLVFMKFNPGATAPTDDYDVKLKDSDGDDVLEGIAEDRDTTTSEFLPTAGSGVLALREFNGNYTFDVSNAGSSKQGTCVLRFRWK